MILCSGVPVQSAVSDEVRAKSVLPFLSFFPLKQMENLPVGFLDQLSNMNLQVSEQKQSH